MVTTEMKTIIRKHLGERFELITFDALGRSSNWGPAPCGYSTDAAEALKRARAMGFEPTEIRD